MPRKIYTHGASIFDIHPDRSFGRAMKIERDESFTPMFLRFERKFLQSWSPLILVKFEVARKACPTRREYRDQERI